MTWARAPGNGSARFGYRNGLAARALLDSAAGRPRSSAFGQDSYPVLAHNAAALLHSVAGNHALVDGNKRLAWLATVVFLDLDLHAVNLTPDGAFDLVMDVAAGAADVEEIAERLRVVRVGKRARRSGLLQPPGKVRRSGRGT